MSCLSVDVRLSHRLACVRPCATIGLDTCWREHGGLATSTRLAYALSGADLDATCEPIVAACERLVPA